MRYEFNSDYADVGLIEHPYRVDVNLLADEKMLFSCDFKFAKRNGGLLTKAVLNNIEELNILNTLPDHLNVVIDTRVHMLMEHMYPAIPGWHCDGVPRSEKYSQPDLYKVDSSVRFWACTLSTNEEGCSNTEFLENDVTLDINTESVWSSVDQKLNSTEEKFTYFVPDGRLIRFGQTQLHRASPCHTPGWRFFFRMGFVPTRAANKVRNQVQVYTVQGVGW